jgi:hypothetical protein
MRRSARPTLKELLLAEAPRAEISVPPRGRLRRRQSRAKKVMSSRTVRSTDPG